MTADRVRLLRPNGKPFWLIYGIRRLQDHRLVYIGRTRLPLWARWSQHGVNAANPGSRRFSPLLAQAFLRDGMFAFQPEPLACCLSELDAAWTEETLIHRHSTLDPDGFNSAAAISGGRRSPAFTARHKAAIQKALDNLTPEQRANRSANARRNGEITRAKWQTTERTARLEFLRRSVDTEESRAKVREATKRAWADPAKRPARLAQLRKAIAISVANRRRRAKIKDARQDDLI